MSIPAHDIRRTTGNRALQKHVIRRIGGNHVYLLSRGYENCDLT